MQVMQHPAIFAMIVFLAAVIVTQARVRVTELVEPVLVL